MTDDKSYEICTVEKVTDDKSYEICTLEQVIDDKSYEICTGSSHGPSPDDDDVEPN
jgi:hypothetical protein